MGTSALFPPYIAVCFSPCRGADDHLPQDVVEKGIRIKGGREDLGGRRVGEVRGALIFLRSEAEREEADQRQEPQQGQHDDDHRAASSHRGRRHGCVNRRPNSGESKIAFHITRTSAKRWPRPGRLLLRERLDDGHLPQKVLARIEIFHRDLDCLHRSHTLPLHHVWRHPPDPELESAPGVGLSELLNGGAVPDVPGETQTY